MNVNGKATSATLITILAMQVMTGILYSQDRGSSPFEGLENSIIRKRIAEETLAVEALEEEITFRKTRLAMLESGAKNRKLYDAKINRPEISKADFVDKPREVWDVLPRWKNYLGDSSESRIKKLESTFSKLRRVQSWYLLAKKERVDLEHQLLCKNRDLTLRALARAPSSQSWISQVERQFEMQIEEVESSRENLVKWLVSSGNTNLDFSAISESDLRNGKENENRNTEERNGDIVEETIFAVTDCVLAVYVEDHGFASDGKISLVFAIWRDGKCLLSRDLNSGGSPYYSCQIEATKIDLAIERLKTDGIFDIAAVKPYPGSNYTTIALNVDGNLKKLKSAHVQERIRSLQDKFREATPDIGEPAKEVGRQPVVIEEKPEVEGEKNSGMEAESVQKAPSLFDRPNAFESLKSQSSELLIHRIAWQEVRILAYELAFGATLKQCEGRLEQSHGSIRWIEKREVSDKKE